jgi:long-chain acyl-CoA synthetase
MSLPENWPAMSLAQAHAVLTAPGMPFEMSSCVIRGIATRTWKNAPPTLRDAFCAARAAFSDRVFLVLEEERITYEAFARASIAAAHRMIAAGVRKGDRVAVVMRNLPEWVVCTWGALLAGAIVAPLNAWWTGPELAYGLADSGTRMLCIDAERWERVTPHLSECSELRTVWLTRWPAQAGDPRAACPAGVSDAIEVVDLHTVIGSWAQWADSADAPLPSVDLDPEDDAMIFYTSGTTGRPKGAVNSQRNCCSGLLAPAFSQMRNFLRRGEPLPAPDPDAPQRSSLLSVPFFHVTGCLAVLFPSMVAGAKIVLMRRFEPERAMQLIERERITQCGGVPTIAWQLLEHPARDRYDLSSLEVVSYGGAPAASELVRRIKQTWPKSMPGIGWGMSETSATFTSHSAEEYLFRPESAGPALPVCEMKICDDDGRELPVGAVGELWAKGPNVVRGYWGKPDATAQTFVDGWIKTGDLARLDDEGFLYIVDRKKDMLIRGGENIYCIEVEDALYQHEAVMDAAVVGRAHPILGEEPVAVVTLKPGGQVSELALRQFVAERLAAFKVPVQIKFHLQTLPRNANGKILKSDVKKLFVE